MARRRALDQLPIAPPYVDHEHAKELETMSAVLDELPQELWEAVERDLTGGRSPNRGRKGMTPEQVVRILLVKQMTGISYDRLVLVLLEFTCYRNFCRIELDTDALGHRGPRPVVLETLPPPSDPVGQRIRLDNLGSPTIPRRPMPSRSSSDHELTVTGLVDGPTQAKLVEVHGH